MIYIIHISTIFFLFILSKVFLKNNTFFIISSFIYSMLVFGQRWMVGTDFGNYLIYYVYNYQGTEFGYRTIQNFFSENNLSFSLMVFLLYLITKINFYNFFNKFGQNKVWIILFYLISEIYFLETSQIRQWLAVSFFINSFYYYKFQKKYFKTALNIFLGSLFHQSILFVIPLLLISFKEITREKWIILLLLLMFLPVIDLKSILPFFSGISIVDSYLDSPYIANLSLLHLGKYYFLIFITFLFLKNIRYNHKDKKILMIIDGQILYLILYGLSVQLGAFLRYSYFFKIYEIIFFVYLIPYLINYNRKKISIFLIGYFILIYISISYLDLVELSHYQIRWITVTEPYSRIELINEFNTFLFKVGR